MIIRQSMLLYAIELLEKPPTPERATELRQSRVIATHFTDDERLLQEIHAVRFQARRQMPEPDGHRLGRQRAPDPFVLRGECVGSQRACARLYGAGHISLV